MAKIDDTDTKDTEVATEVATTDTANQMTFQFNAQTHVEHFREIFTEYYDIALSDWAKADSRQYNNQSKGMPFCRS